MKKCPFCFPNVPKFLPAMRHLSQTYFNLARTLLVIPISKQLSANTLNLRQSDIWGNLCNLLVICHMIFDNSGSNSVASLLALYLIQTPLDTSPRRCFSLRSKSYAQVYLNIYFLELLSDLRNRKWLIRKRANI